MNGAESFVTALEDAGVTTFFGLPGSTEAPLLEAIRAGGSLRYVLSLHEGATVSMADGYARAGGRPGVVGLHTTVGTLNGASQIYNAWRDKAPLVVTAGHKDRTVLAEDAFCSTPSLPDLVRQFTKWSWQSLDAGAIGADFRRALQHAMAPPKGPSYLALPEDLLACDVGDPPRLRFDAPAADYVAGGRSISAAVDLLCSASKPVLVAGSWAGGALEELRAAADAFGLPLTTAEFTDLAALPYPLSDPRHLGLYREEKDLFEDCDLVLAVGARVFYAFSNATRPRLPEGARLVHVSEDASEISKSIVADVGLIGDVGLVLSALVRELESRGGLEPSVAKERAARIVTARAARVARVEGFLSGASEDVPLSVERLSAELNASLPAGVLLVDEAVRSSRRMLELLQPPLDAAVLRTSGGSLGWGVPAAVGAKLACPDRPVVAVVGDGSLQFSVQSFWTAVAESAPVVVVVLDNGGYLAVKRAIEGYLKVPRDDRTHPGTEFSGIDHVGLARAYGADGVEIDRAGDLADAVRSGLATEKPYLIRVPVAAVRP